MAGAEEGGVFVFALLEAVEGGELLRAGEEVDDVATVQIDAFGDDGGCLCFVKGVIQVVAGGAAFLGL